MPIPDPPQLLIELPARNRAEAARLRRLARLLTLAASLPDVRDLAPAVRRLFPEPAYLVGCGSAHIWLHHAGSAHRLAIIR
jgi:hypothetical protein